MSHQLKIVLLITFLSFLIWHVEPRKDKPPTNPRQIRNGSPTYNPKTDRPKLDIVAKFLLVANRENYFQDIEQECDPVLHKLWADPANGKNLLDTSGDFHTDISWHNKICNFLAYLDCSETNKTCECAPYSASQPNRYNLDLVYDKEKDDPKYDRDKETQKKRRCRSKLGEICNYVRILPTPNKAFPGIDFDINDQFDCVTNATCKDTGKNKDDGFYYERCVLSTGSTQYCLELLFMQLIVFFYMLYN